MGRDALCRETVTDEASALRLLSAYWETASSRIRISPLEGGITNRLYRATYRNEHVLVRILGAAGSMLIDRDREGAIVSEISNCGFGPRILCTFANGRVEEFFSAHRPLQPHELLHASVSAAIAASLARLHALPVKATQSERPEIFQNLVHWLDLASSSFEKINTQPSTASSLTSASLSSEVAWLREFLTAVVARPSKSIIAEHLCRLVFCHNDLLAGNVLVEGAGEGSGERSGDSGIIFIDFEYSAYNAAAFDIANHFAAVPESSLIQCGRYGALPGRDFQVAFLRHYCEAGGLAIEEEEDFIEALDVLSVFHLAAELRWVLWALVQAGVSQEIFDYSNYAQQRLQHGYLAHKAKLRGTTL